MTRLVYFYLLMVIVLLTTTGCYVQYPPFTGTIIEEHNIVSKHTSIKDIIYAGSYISSKSKSVIDPNIVSIKKQVLFGLWYKYTKVALFDSLRILTSVNNISDFVRSQGFYNNNVTYTVDTLKISQKKKQTHVRINYFITFNDVFFINNITLDLDKKIKKYIEKNNLNLFENESKEIASFATIENMSKKIIALHKELGFYNIESNYIKAELDTITSAYKTKNRYVDILFFYSKPDSIKFKQFIINNVGFVPLNNKKTTKILTYKDIYYVPDSIKVSPHILYSFNTLHKGKYFNETEYRKSLEQVRNLNVWNILSMESEIIKDTIINADTLGRINFRYLTEHNKKYGLGSELGFGYNFYQNNSQAIINQNSFGVNLTGTLNIKNVYKKAVENNVTLRAAAETFLTDLSLFKISTVDLFANFTQQIPWLYPSNQIKLGGSYLSSAWNLSGGYTNRINYFNLKKIILSFDWKADNAKKHISINVQPASFSVIVLDKSALFLADELLNPFLRYAFNEGIILGTNVQLIKSFQYSKSSVSTLSLYAEESGLTWGTIYNAIAHSYGFKRGLFNFVKFAGSLTHLWRWKKSALALRLRGGYGYSWGDDTLRNKTMPFFKQFAGGGPNSMRGWNYARLGLGSSDQVISASFKDRFGDILLEGNIEYRFNAFRLFSLQFEGALFTDVGNIWNRRPVENEGVKSTLRINSIAHDLAISVGTGLRLNFGFMVIRIDGGFRVKDPLLPNQWLNPINTEWNNIGFQFGLGYPF